MDVEEQGARGVGGVGDVEPAAGEAPEEIRIDGAEGELAGLGPGADAGHVVEDPGDLGAGEIGIEDQAGLRRHRGLVARLLQAGADPGRAPILPDDGAMHRLAGALVPDQRRLALVGDADRRHVPGRHPGLLHRRPAGLEGGAPEVLRLVLDPARGREMLRELGLGEARDRGVGPEQQGARGGGALVDGEDEGGHRKALARCVRGAAAPAWRGRSCRPPGEAARRRWRRAGR